MKTTDIKKNEVEITSPNGAGKKAAAFFDLDRTLMAGSSAYHFGRAAYKAGSLTRREIANDAWQQIRFRLRGSTDETANALRDRILESIKGQSVVELGRLSPEIMAGILPRIYPQMLEAVRWHQDNGRSTYIATAAWKEVVDLLAATLRMDGCVSTVAEVVDGHYTGGLIGPFAYGEGKAQGIRELADREGIDLEASYAYSDSVSDLPMMRVVGHPVAVNPDAGLKAIAREEGWELMRFEKLGRRLIIGATTVLASAVGGSGTWLVFRKKGRKKLRSIWSKMPLRR